MIQVVYISIPITGREDTYDARLELAIREVKTAFPDAAIVTPKDVADELVKKGISEPTEADYLSADIWTIMTHATDIYLCRGWAKSKGCTVEIAAANAYGKSIHYQTQVRHGQGKN